MRVTLFAGMTRSGSTLLGKVLAQSPSVVYVGELAQAIHYGSLSVETCSCGLPVFSCPFWSALVHPDLTIKDLPDLYEAIGIASGVSTIIDSSKLAWLNYRVSKIVEEAHQTKVLQIVRDPRAVRLSWTRSKLRAKGALRVYGAWVVRNVQARLLRRVGRPEDALLLCYEELCDDPGVLLSEVFEWLDVTPVQLLEGKRVPFRRGFHAVAGNPNRRHAGDFIDIRLDEEFSSLPIGRFERILYRAAVHVEGKRYGYGI